MDPRPDWEDGWTIVLKKALGSFLHESFGAVV